MEHFNCFKCGGSDLIYQKRVKSIEKVRVHGNKHIEHYQQEIDETDVLGAEHYYICACCGMPPMFRVDYVTTEDELVEYLSMTLKERAEMLAEYFAIDEELYRLTEDEGYIDEDSDDSEPEN